MSHGLISWWEGGRGRGEGGERGREGEREEEVRKEGGKGYNVYKAKVNQLLATKRIFGIIYMKEVLCTCSQKVGFPAKVPNVKSVQI